MKKEIVNRCQQRTAARLIMAGCKSSEYHDAGVALGYLTRPISLKGSQWLSVTISEGMLRWMLKTSPMYW